MKKLQEGKNQSLRGLFWQKHILAWESCSNTLSLVEYCRRKDLNVSTFRYWKHNLSNQESRPTIIEIPFLPQIEKKLPESGKSPFTLCSKNGYRLEIGNEFCQSALHKIIEILSVPHGSKSCCAITISNLLVVIVYFFLNNMGINHGDEK